MISVYDPEMLIRVRKALAGRYSFDNWFSPLIRIN